MTNLLNDPVYIDWQDVLDTTTITSLITELTSDINYADWMITQAQRIIDNYIGWFPTPFDEDQTYIFPIDKDWLAEIPTDIKLATVYIVEYLYLNGWTSASTTTTNVKSEKNLWRTVTYKDSSWAVETDSIPIKALNILNKYKGNLFVGQVI